MGWAAFDSSGRPVVVNATAVPKISYTQNFPLQQAAPVLVGTLTATGTTAASAAANPFGSSVSLQRLVLAGSMALTEVDLVFGAAFPATNQGQGSLSQSFVVYSFGNSTSLASVLSASRAVTWATGTTTSGTSSSLQQGWTGPNIQPFTFAASTLSAGEYAIGHLMSWAAASTSWTVSVYGLNANSSQTVSAATNLTSASLAAASTFATGSSAVSVFSATPTSAPVFVTITGTSVALLVGSHMTASTAANVLSSAGFNAGSVHTASTSSAITAWNAAPSAFAFGKVGSTASGVTNASSALSVTATAAASTVSFLMNTATAAAPVLLSGGFLAGSFHTGSTSGAVFSAGGLLAGSFLTASGVAGVLSNSGTAAMAAALSMTTNSVAAVTNVAVATGSSTLMTRSTPTFGYNGSIAMTTATSQAIYQAGPFTAGVFLSGSVPTAIDLKSTAAIVTASQALIQPWFALVGS